MKKVLSGIILVSGLLFAENTLFSGTWLVEDDGIRITFEEENKISFDSEDGSVAGTGTYSYTDTLMQASIINSDMNMNIVYKYKQEDGKIRVQTQSVTVNGDTLNTQPVWYTITRQ